MHGRRQVLTSSENPLIVQSQLTAAVNKGRLIYVIKTDFRIQVLGGSWWKVEVKNAKAEDLIEELGPAILRWQSNGRIAVHDGDDYRVLKQAVIGPQLDELQGCAGTIWRIPQSTYDDLILTGNIRGKDVLGFLKAQGITVQPFDDIDVAVIAAGTGAR